MKAGQTVRFHPAIVENHVSAARRAYFKSVRGLLVECTQSHAWVDWLDGSEVKRYARLMIVKA